MIKSYDRTPLSRLQFLERFPTPHKPHIKISNNKLPSDFFAHRNIHQFTSSTSRVRNQPQTQSEYRSRYLNSKIKSDVVKRNNMTAREKNNREEDLIMGVISSAREMRKVIRKHSMELKKQNKPQTDEMRIQLPPLLLKKGLTTPF